MARMSAGGRARVGTHGSTEGAPPISELLRSCSTSAVHLEMRDVYTPSDPWFRAWLAGRGAEFEQRLERPWLDLVREVTGRGVVIQRVRVVSEPVTDYVAFEHSTTASNVAAGEQVRWLPRRQASDLVLPGNDFWVFDARLVRFGYFSGDGDVLGHELVDDPAVVRTCVVAFEAAWQRAIPHEEYQLAR